MRLLENQKKFQKFRKIFEIFCFSQLSNSWNLIAFRATIGIKVCKMIFMITRIDWTALQVRAHGCAHGDRTPPCQDFCILGMRIPRARSRARTCSVFQSIFLLIEIILHTLIANVNLKAMKSHEFDS